MPTYEYACKSCDEHVEVVQSFKDDALTTCPSCGGPLRKVFGSIGIAFKGSGFYKTDNRPSGKSDTAAVASTPDKAKATPDKPSTTPEKAASAAPADSGKKAVS